MIYFLIIFLSFAGRARKKQKNSDGNCDEDDHMSCSSKGDTDARVAAATGSKDAQRPGVAFGTGANLSMDPSSSIHGAGVPGVCVCVCVYQNRLSLSLSPPP